ncbi:MAG: 50S ribosomal protein L1 [Candidatus Omnitrophota bacterium]
MDLLQKMPAVKFDQTVDLSCKLNADPKKSDQVIRNSVILPHGTGKDIKILVFCEPEKEEEAKKAGADFVGGQEMIDKIMKDNWFGFDICISTPSMMRLVSKAGKILGPRGKMPSPKTGTVSDNIADAVKEAKAGKIEFRMDKFGCLSVGVGKLSFLKNNLVENIKVLLEAVNNSKPPSVKGELIKSIYVSATMSPSLRLKPYGQS